MNKLTVKSGSEIAGKENRVGLQSLKQNMLKYLIYENLTL